MRTFEEIQHIAIELGFRSLMPCSGIHNPKKLCELERQRIAVEEPQWADKTEEAPNSGIYCQFRSNGDIYIGKTTDLLRRHPSHIERRQYTVDFLAFRFCPPDGLDDEEKRFIDRGIALHLDLANKVYNWDDTEDTPTPTYDSVVSIVQQETHFNQLVQRTKGDMAWQTLSRTARSWEVAEWDAFMITPAHEQILAHAREFVSLILPQPHRSVETFWQISLASVSSSAVVPHLTIWSGISLLLKIFSFYSAPSALWAMMPFYVPWVKRCIGDQDIATAFPWVSFDLNPLGKETERDSSTENADPNALIRPIGTSVLPVEAVPAGCERSLLRYQHLYRYYQTLPEADQAIMRASPITHVDLREIGTLTVPLTMMTDTLINTVLTPAVALAAMAFLKTDLAVHQTSHNRLAAHKLLLHV